MVIVHFSFLGIPGCVPQSHFMKWEGELQECSPVAVIPGDERGRVAGTRVGVGTCLYWLTKVPWPGGTGTCVVF